jgi:hypothetical protein
MKRFMMIAVVLGGLVMAGASSAKADHLSGGGRSGFGISLNYGNGFNNFGGSYYNGGSGYGSPYGGYGGGYGGAYRSYNPYPTYSVPIYRGGYGGGYGGYGGGYGGGGYGGGGYGGGGYGGHHGHCR